jgi:hypothetical protein
MGKNASLLQKKLRTHDLFSNLPKRGKEALHAPPIVPWMVEDGREKDIDGSRCSTATGHYPKKVTNIVTIATDLVGKLRRAK